MQVETNPGISQTTDIDDQLSVEDEKLLEYQKLNTDAQEAFAFLLIQVGASAAVVGFLLRAVIAVVSGNNLTEAEFDVTIGLEVGFVVFSVLYDVVPLDEFFKIVKKRDQLEAEIIRLYFSQYLH